MTVIKQLLTRIILSLLGLIVVYYVFFGSFQDTLILLTDEKAWLTHSQLAQQRLHNQMIQEQHMAEFMVQFKTGLWGIVGFLAISVSVLLIVVAIKWIQKWSWLRPEDGTYPLFIQNTAPWYLKLFGHVQYTVINPNLLQESIAVHSLPRGQQTLKSVKVDGDPELTKQLMNRHASALALSGLPGGNKLSVGAASLLSGRFSNQQLKNQAQKPVEIKRNEVEKPLYDEIHKLNLSNNGQMILGFNSQSNTYCSWPYTSAQQIAIVGANGTGKALPNNTPVLTISGWKQISKLSEDDLVASNDGKFYSLEGIYPQGFKKVMRIIFHDGSEIVASDAHLWEVLPQGESSRPLIVSTNGLCINDEIPITAPIKSPVGEFPVSPYIMGALIASATFRSWNHYSLKTKNAGAVKHANDVLRQSGSKSYFVQVMEPQASREAPLYFRAVEVEKEIIGALSALGLARVASHDKFIPAPYMKGSVRQRQAFVQGFFDTAGWVSGNSYCALLNAPRVVTGLTELIESLGGLVHVVDRCGQYYFTARCPLSLSLTLQTPPTEPEPLKRRIVALQPLADLVECTCIKISAPSALFITQRHIVTHNTSNVGAIIVETFVNKKLPVVVLDPKRGADWGVFGSTIQRIDCDPTNIVEHLRTIMKVVEERKELCADFEMQSIEQLPDDVRPKPMAVVLEELGDLRDQCKITGDGTLSLLDSYLERIMRISRYTGLYMILIDQRPMLWPKVVSSNIKFLVVFKMGMNQGASVGYYHADKLADFGQFAYKNTVYDSWLVLPQVQQYLTTAPRQNRQSKKAPIKITAELAGLPVDNKLYESALKIVQQSTRTPKSVLLNMGFNMEQIQELMKRCGK